MDYQHTLELDIPYPERMSRPLIFVKWLLLIPHWIVLILLSIGLVFSFLFSWIGILIIGNYPRSLFEFNVMVLQWYARVWCYGGPWLYFTEGGLLTDAYPPFGDGDHPVKLNLSYPPHLSRWLNFLFPIKWILLFPHAVVLLFLGIAAYVISWIAFFAILILGRYPNGLFDFMVGYRRWYFRCVAYYLLMTDAYPPFEFGQPAPHAVSPAVPVPQGSQTYF